VTKFLNDVNVCEMQSHLFHYFIQYINYKFKYKTKSFELYRKNFFFQPKKIVREFIQNYNQTKI
jgi:hypothetical protein